MILILDHESGNLRSISNALDSLNINNRIVKNLSDVDKYYSHIIVPGVGSYNEVINNLKKRNFDKFLIENKLKNIPILGICVGMQVLSTIGSENSVTKGLDLIKGEVKSISELNPDYSCHVGWNNIFSSKDSLIFKDINLNCEFYFDHSYFFQPANSKNILCTSKYNLDYCSGVVDNNLIGLQFHPEKSHKNGISIYKNFYNFFNA